MAESTMRRCVIAALTVVFLVLPESVAAGDELAKLRAERNELELQLEGLRRNIPLPADMDAIRERLTKLASRAELDHAFGNGSAPERLLFPDGRPSPIEMVRVVVEGKDRFGDLTFFLSTVQYGGGIVQLDSMKIVADSGATVRYTARLALPQYAGEPVEPARYGGSEPNAAMRASVESLRQQRDLLLEVVGQKRPENVCEALEVLTKRAEASAIALREVRVDGELVLEGVTVGGSARATLSKALEAARLEVVKTTISDTGLCRSFVISARVGDPSEGSDEIVVDNGLFDATLPAGCAGAQSGATKQVSAKGKDPKGLTINLRNADVAGAFRVLSDATGENFVLDFDVDGRVQLVVENATVDETIKALGALNIDIGPPPLRRVSNRGAVIAESSEDFSGEPVTMSLQRADLPSVLCVFSNVSGLTLRMPAGLERDVSIFASDLPWDRMLEGVLAAQRLQYVIEGGSVLVGADARTIKSSSLVDACAGSSTSPLPSRLALLTLDQLDSADLVVDGVARGREGWRAWMEMPTGRLQLLEPGSTLLDGEIDAIDERGVTIARLDGSKRLISLSSRK